MYALPKPQRKFRHVCCGSGGPPAVLTGVGFVAGLFLCDVPLNEIETKGGVSAGAINALMLAAKLKVADQIRYLLQCNFSKLFPSKNTRAKVLTDLVRGELEHDEIVRIGLRSTEPFGLAMEQIAAVWPKGFWLLGSCGKKYYLFTDEAVFEILPGQPPHRIHNGPAPLGLAMRITITIPAWMDPVHWKDRQFLDGCFTPYGRCPTGVVRDYFGGEPETTIGCVSKAPETVTDRLLTRFGMHLSGAPAVGCEPIGTLVHPSVDEISRRLQFVLDRQQKEAAVLAGFRQTVQVMHNLGVTSETKHKELVEVGHSFDNLSQAVGLTDEPLPYAEWQEDRQPETKFVSAGGADA
jgi:hypothetical protein